MGGGGGIDLVTTVNGNDAIATDDGTDRVASDVDNDAVDAGGSDDSVDARVFGRTGDDTLITDGQTGETNGDLVDGNCGVAGCNADFCQD